MAEVQVWVPGPCVRNENAPEKQAGVEKQPERRSWTVTTTFPSEEAVLSLQAGDACKLLRVPVLQ